MLLYNVYNSILTLPTYILNRLVDSLRIRKSWMVANEVADEDEQTEEIVETSQNVDCHLVLILAQVRDLWYRTNKMI